MNRVLALLRRVLDFYTPAGTSPAEVAAEDRGMRDAHADNFDPPQRKELRKAYMRGWNHIQMQW